MAAEGQGFLAKVAANLWYLSDTSIPRILKVALGVSFEFPFQLDTPRYGQTACAPYHVVSRSNTCKEGLRRRAVRTGSYPLPLSLLAVEKYGLAIKLVRRSFLFFFPPPPRSEISVSQRPYFHYFFLPFL